MKTTCAALLVLGLMAVPVLAETIFTSFGPSHAYDDSDGFLQVGCTTNDYNPVCTPSRQVYIAAAFTVGSADVTLSQVDLALGYNPRSLASPPFSALIELTNDLNGLPGGTVLESWTLGVPDASPGSIVTGMSLITPSLSANTQYWLVVKPGVYSFQLGWMPSLDVLGTEACWFTYLTTDWEGPYSDLLPAFDVIATTAVPEPSSLLLLGSGLGLIGWAAGRRKRH